MERRGGGPADGVVTKGLLAADIPNDDSGIGVDG